MVTSESKLFPQHGKRHLLLISKSWVSNVGLLTDYLVKSGVMGAGQSRPLGETGITYDLAIDESQGMSSREALNELTVR